MAEKYRNALGSIMSIYFFVSSIVLIKDSAKIMGAALAEKMLLLIRDTTSATFAGWISTALLQSSGAFDSIVVSLTSTGVIPLSLAVAAIIGAEVGTTITPLIVSIFERMKGDQGSEAGFNVTMSHVLYNIVTLAIFYPLELFFGVFTNIAMQGTGIFVKLQWLNAIPDVLDVLTPWIGLLLEHVPPWLGLVLGIVLLVMALSAVEKHMTAIFSMPRSWNFIRSTFMKPGRAFLAGFLFTVLVPSTSVMVSLLVPLATSGVIRAEYYILPYILGANIGTVFDVMIAALATGDPVSLGVWLVHLVINLVGALIFLPILRPFASLTRRAARFISSSLRVALIMAALFYILPAAIILYYYVAM